MHQRVAVRVQAGRADADHQVAIADRATVDDLILLDCTHAESGEIIFSRLIQTRHLGGFASDECCACLQASLSNACDDGFRLGTFQATRCEVIKKEKRFRAAYDHIVNTHGDQIDANGVVTIHFKRQFEFCANAIGTGDKYGGAKASGRQFE